MVTQEQITEIANQLKSYKLQSIVPKFLTGEEFLAWVQTDEAGNKTFDDSYCDIMIAFLKGYNKDVEYMLFIDRMSCCNLISFRPYDSIYQSDRRGAIIAELAYETVKFGYDSCEDGSVVANSIQLTVRDYTDDYRTAKHYLDIAISYEELKQLSKELYNH